ncbi:pectate lyase [Uliginosibacterium sp. H3]|uniref:pectate lyase n=1 Tax=Uliginosibacterium silvisoli TaxID=3114758 RepID=A0ABU6JXS7_9RHOO|nr:pectate lyase [Uliginosibacterium sp. H3]
MKANQLALLALLAGVTAGANAANRPAGYTTVCTEGKTCSLPANTNVAYGRSDQFTYKVLSGSFVCSEATFGAGTKVSGGTNECSAPSGTSSSSASSTAPSSSSSSKSSTAPSSSSSSSKSSSVPSSSSSSKSSSSAASSGGSANVKLPAWPGCPAYVNPSETVALTASISVPAGTTYDGGGKRFQLSNGGQSEGQPPVFDLQEGATLRNVVIGNLAADGVHCVGNCTVYNTWWEDVGEDAATALGGPGTTMRVDCGGSFLGTDKTFQHNGQGTLHITRFVADNWATKGGKFYRSCGDCTGNKGPRTVIIENSRIHNHQTIVGVNSSYSNGSPRDSATLRNVLLLRWNGEIEVCSTYKGVEKGSGSSSNIGSEWNTATCNVSPSDITAVDKTGGSKKTGIAPGNGVDPAPVNRIQENWTY